MRWLCLSLHSSKGSRESLRDVGEFVKARLTYNQDLGSKGGRGGEECTDILTLGDVV